MGNVIAFGVSDSHERQPGYQQPRDLTDFWLLAEGKLRNDIEHEASKFRQQGYRPQLLEEAAPDEGGDHVTMFYSGLDTLQNFFFAFSIRDDAPSKSLRAEIRVLTGDLSTAFHKNISSIPYKNYSQRWLEQSFLAAQSDTAAQPERTKARG